MEQDEIIRIKEMNLLAANEINTGNYQKALEFTYEIKNNFAPDPNVSLVVGGLLIEIGRFLRDKNITSEGIDLISKDLDAIVNIQKNPSITYYLLSNGYYDLFHFKWDENPFFNCFKKTELDETKINLRNALKYDTSNPEIFINLGNCYDHLGRTVEALECYEKALELEANEPMAFGNKGIALCKYSFLLGKRFKTILIDAHYFISTALDLGVVPGSEESFKWWLTWIEKHFEDKNVFKNPPNFPGYKIESQFELDKYIKEFIIEEKLYLNVCSFCQKCDASIGDTIIIEEMKVPLDKDSFDNNLFFRLTSYLNQIKEDYISARFLLILSQYENLNLNFAYNEATFVDTLDYSIYNMNTQLLKLSFKNFYDILDKIAFFINDYLNLNHEVWQIDFRKIWYSKWKGKPIDSIIDEKIIKTNSYGLNALYDIHWDFEEGGPYNNLRKTRNALTHRYVKIKMFCDVETEEEMKEETFLNQTLKLSKIVRNAIFYLMYFVNELETKKTH